MCLHVHIIYTYLFGPTDSLERAGTTCTWHVGRFANYLVNYTWMYDEYIVSIIICAHINCSTVHVVYHCGAV